MSVGLSKSCSIALVSLASKAFKIRKACLQSSAGWHVRVDRVLALAGHTAYQRGNVVLLAWHA
jgi:hypothetical protein